MRSAWEGLWVTYRLRSLGDWREERELLCSKAISHELRLSGLEGSRWCVELS